MVIAYAHRIVATALGLMILPLAAQSQQTITVPCLQNVQNGQVLFDNTTLPILPEKHRWTLLRYQPTGQINGEWQDGQCTVEEIMRR